MEPPRIVDNQASRAVEPVGPLFDELVVAADSVIGLEIESAISTERAKVEDPVVARVTRDVRVGNRVAIPAGSRANGEVTTVERGGRLKDRARLGVRFTSIVLADGTRVPIQTETIYREGDSPTNESAAKIGGGAIGGAIIGGILGGGKGAAIGSIVGAGAGSGARGGGWAERGDAAVRNAGDGSRARSGRGHRGTLTIGDLICDSELLVMIVAISLESPAAIANDHSYLPDELISEPVHGEDVLRVARVVFELLPQPGDVDVDGPRRRHRVVAPHLVEQLVARQRGAAMLDEVPQQLELARGQVERLPGLGHFRLAEIH